MLNLISRQHAIKNHNLLHIPIERSPVLICCWIRRANVKIIRKIEVDIRKTAICNYVRKGLAVYVKLDCLGRSIDDNGHMNPCAKMIVDQEAIRVVCIRVKASAIEGNIVADFPLCNKSFNCSYSGHDL